MRVKATIVGEHPLGKWRQPGDIFEFEGDTPGSWMVDPATGEPFTDKPKAKASPKPKAKPAPESNED